MAYIPSIQFNTQAPSSAAWTSATSLNTALTLSNVSGYGTVLVSFVVSGSITGGVITFEGFDGTNWWTVPLQRNTTFTLDTTYTLTGSNQVWQGDISGYQQFRVRLSTVITGAGTANIIEIPMAAENVTNAVVGQPTASNLNATVVGTGTFAVQSAQSGTWTVQPGNTANTTPWLATISQGGNSATVTSRNSIYVEGPTASGSSLVANPITIGGLAKTSLPTAVSDGQVVNEMTDKFGRRVILLNGMRDIVNPITQLTLTSTTTETTLISGVASVFNDLLSLVVINTSATATQVDFRDSTAGTIRLSLYIPAGDTRGIVFNTPLPQAAVNTAWTAKCGTSVASVIITGSYIANK